MSKVKKKNLLCISVIRTLKYKKKNLYHICPKNTIWKQWQISKISRQNWWNKCSSSPTVELRLIYYLLRYSYLVLSTVNWLCFSLSCCVLCNMDYSWSLLNFHSGSCDRVWNRDGICYWPLLKPILPLTYTHFDTSMCVYAQTQTHTDTQMNLGGEHARWGTMGVCPPLPFQRQSYI